MATLVSVESMVNYFESLPDPRHTRNRRHLLVDVIVLAVAGVIVGCDGPTAIARWATAKADWLKTILALPGGIPSRDCIRRILSTLKPQAFQECFQDWLAACLESNSNGTIRLIAIDGKTSRRSHDRGKGLGPLHLVSAWASEQGVSLGQLATEEKSNEITAIPQLLEQIDVRGALVTIDAMGCQKEIAKKIRAGGGDYVLAVKENQPKLHQAILDFFEEHLDDDLSRVSHRRHETKEKGHGRFEERYYYLAKVPEDFACKKSWPSIQAIGKAISIRTTADGHEQGDVRYYIVSRFVSGERYAQAVRGHWGIENSLHWVMDVTFDEDQSRTRDRHMADNLSWLRRFGISLLKQHPRKDSIKGKSQIAGWDNEFLMQVLTLQHS